MSNLHGLLYPATYLRKNTMERIAQVFSKLTVLVPTEDVDSTAFPSSSNSSMTINTAAPAPLGDRLDWFTDLIRNWKAWAEEMGLGEKFPASALLTSATGEEESVLAILNALKDKEEPDPLLEAQIFLHLAFDLDRREDELRIALDEVAVREDKLKSILQDPDKPTDPSVPPKNAHTPMIEPLSRAKEHLKAWAMLWDKLPAGELWLIGESIAIKDLLDSAYEALRPGACPVDLLNLILPLDPAKRPGESEDLRTKLTAIIETISQEGLQDVIKDGKIQTLAEQIELSWTDTIANQIPGPTLNLTLYPDTSFDEVLSKQTNLNLYKKAESHQKIGWSFFLV